MVTFQSTRQSHDNQVFAAAMSFGVEHQPPSFRASALEANLIGYQLQAQNQQTRLPRIWSSTNFPTAFHF